MSVDPDFFTPTWKDKKEKKPLTAKQRRQRRRRRAARRRNNSTLTPTEARAAAKAKENSSKHLKDVLNPNNVLGKKDGKGRTGQTSKRNPNKHPDRHRGPLKLTPAEKRAAAAAKAKKSGHGPGKKGGGGRRGGGGGNYSTDGMIYYGLGEFPGVNRREARTIVGNDTNRLIRELMGDARAQKKGLQFDVNQANALFDRTKGDLDYVHGEVDDFTQAQNAKINQNFGNTKNQLQALFEQLQGTQQGGSDQARNAALAEQQRLGIQQSGMGQFDADAANAANIAAQNQAGTMANINTMQSGSNQIGEMLRSMGQASLASAVGRATNDRNDYIQEARQDNRGNLNEILQQIRGVRKDRPDKVNELHMLMEQNAYSRFAEGQQMDFNNQLSANQFNLDVSKHNSSNLWNKAKLRQEAKRQAALRRNQKRQFEQMQGGSKKINSSLADIFDLS